MRLVTLPASGGRVPGLRLVVTVRVRCRRALWTVARRRVPTLMRVAWAAVLLRGIPLVAIMRRVAWLLWWVAWMLLWRVAWMLLWRVAAALCRVSRVRVMLLWRVTWVATLLWVTVRV